MVLGYRWSRSGPLRLEGNGQSHHLGRIQAKKGVYCSGGMSSGWLFWRGGAINQLSAFLWGGCAAVLLCSWEMVLPAAKAVALHRYLHLFAIPPEQITPLGDREGHMEGTAQDSPRASAQCSAAHR